jgi:hypothetical protein
MYGNWAANLLVVGLTLAAVFGCVLVHYEGLTLLSRWMARMHEHPMRRRVLYMMFGMLLLHVTEIWIIGFALWGALHWPEAGAIVGDPAPSLLDAVYLSAMSYTTVGFGDVVPVGPIRFLAGTAAITGLVLIGWTISFTALEMERFWRVR